MERPITTLFLIISIDGKISSGSSKDLDVDRASPNTTISKRKRTSFQ